MLHVTLLAFSHSCVADRQPTRPRVVEGMPEGNHYRYHKVLLLPLDGYLGTHDFSLVVIFDNRSYQHELATSRSSCDGGSPCNTDVLDSYPFLHERGVVDSLFSLSCTPSLDARER